MHRIRSIRRSVAAAALGLCLVVGASPALAGDYDERRAGHPLRVLAYVVYPVGVIFDYLIFRPAHWVAHYEPLKTVFGHRD